MRTHASSERGARPGKAPVRPLFSALLAFGLLVAVFTGLAAGKASHKGWPRIDGHLKMHSADQSARMHGSPRSDELLGGHGNDVILGRNSADVIWGDYKPCCQPGHQHDVLIGGRGPRPHLRESRPQSDSRRPGQGPDPRPFRSRSHQLRQRARQGVHLAPQPSRLQAAQLREARLPARAPAQVGA